MPNGIEYIDLTGKDAADLRAAIYYEVSGLLDGNHVRAAALGRPPWERDHTGLIERDEEYRTRHELLIDLVALQDAVGWESSEHPVRVFPYPSTLRALRYCEVAADPSEQDIAEGAEAATHKKLLASLLEAFDEEVVRG